MKNLLQHIWIIIIATLLVLPACTSVEKLVDQGNYEEAIEKARRHLSGKKKPNPKYIYALRDALEAANDRDLRYADRLKSRGSSTDWAKVFSTYDQIDRRQEGVRSLLPLVDKHGINTEVKFVKIAGLLADSRNKAAAQAYDEGMAKLELGRRGNKAQARDAYRAFGETRRFLNDYRDAAARQREAEELGIVYVTVKVENETRAFLPAGLERELLRVDTRRLDDQWRRYHLGTEAGIDYDFEARLALNGVNVSPERVTERSFIESKEITDGEEYVLDDNGNVAKDSLGNDITRPRRITIQANILEVYQSKQAVISGELRLYQIGSRQIVERRSLTAEALFENYASTYQGDRRALSSQTRNRLGNQPGPFPTNENLILQAADRLKPLLLEELARTDVTYFAR
ncbi:hypothetical protein CEQ90_05345 [Lewinellaceae bacterium SD302]|nr:hypothetical protein CEQ90_05345 [Lewinellaceae bacterium SD302]